MKVVIDTNVLVSRHLAPSGAPARVFALWEQGAVQIVVSPAILEEYRRALSYEHVTKRHGMSESEVDDVVATVGRLALLMEPETKLSVIVDDPEDNKFLECAVAGEAEYIISGDRHLLKLGRCQGIEILSPSDFLLAVGENRARSG